MLFLVPIRYSYKELFCEASIFKAVNIYRLLNKAVPRLPLLIHPKLSKGMHLTFEKMAKLVLLFQPIRYGYKELFCEASIFKAVNIYRLLNEAVPRLPLLIHPKLSNG